MLKQFKVIQSMATAQELALSKKVQLGHILNLITIIIFAMSSIISRYLFNSRPTAYILGAFCVLLYLMGLIHFVYRLIKIYLY